jgi:hypothetical protein
MESIQSYNSIQFYIVELSKVKDELKKHETEYFPEKVRSLIASYIFTLNKIIQNCEQFLKNPSQDENLNHKVERIKDHYSDLLKSISRH